MQKNVASQKWTVFAFGGAGHASPGEPVTSDASNITANIRLDGGSANAVDDTNPTELEGGYYVFDITQDESNANMISIHPVSSTSDVIVIGVPGAVYTLPSSFTDLVVTNGTVTVTDNTPRPVTGERTNINPSTIAVNGVRL